MKLPVPAMTHEIGDDEWGNPVFENFYSEAQVRDLLLERERMITALQNTIQDYPAGTCS